jgi:ATP-dependent Clp protease ATP-binding subunit ClpA
VDEACSTVRVQLDSKPESIDSLERQGVRLRVEREALKKEKDPISAARLEEVEKELAALEDTLRPLLVGGGWQGAVGAGVGALMGAWTPLLGPWTLRRPLLESARGARKPFHPTLTHTPARAPPFPSPPSRSCATTRRKSAWTPSASSKPSARSCRWRYSRRSSAATWRAWQTSATAGEGRGGGGC